ncbi:hypothetical protein LX16_1889 [Stackebrandtia albiflava]|uniref:Uncharacterized protein n=1 Tax=Stackebrandtia albiflava TaxID=406432 RepID=A0A562VE70_9ACTN|nr:hypothetical protein [Stackebrandtia albiflava]TWJ16165.1 hypothetical protein LX16_1889 [Stackebrandtia albiflava]
MSSDRKPSAVPDAILLLRLVLVVQCAVALLGGLLLSALADPAIGLSGRAEPLRHTQTGVTIAFSLATAAMLAGCAVSLSRPSVRLFRVILLMEAVLLAGWANTLLNNGLGPLPMLGILLVAVALVSLFRQEGKRFLCDGGRRPPAASTPG